MEDFTLASIPKRMFASVIDFSVIAFFAYFVSSIIFQGHECALFLLFCAAMCCYHTYLPISPLGASLGQKIVGIHVATRCAQKSLGVTLAFDRTMSQLLCPTVSVSLMRAIGKIEGDALILSILFLLQVVVLFLWFFWYMVALFRKHRQTFHDIVYDTVVLSK
ncbi:MAG: RDD family protein [Anaplasma sp.]